MTFATPASITAKVSSSYTRLFLKQWVEGESEHFFPFVVQRVGKLTDSRDVDGTVRAVDLLRKHSHAQRGWGYVLEEESVSSRTFGNTLVPRRVVIPTLEDFLRLASRVDHFRATEQVATAVRAHFPTLEPWLRKHVKTLADVTDELEGLIAVTTYFVQHPWPDCYARQLPVPVDTKFVERNERVLAEWLNVLLPSSAIDTNETDFARRFGLRDKDLAVTLRVLDNALGEELGWPFETLTVPLRAVADKELTGITVFIVENRLNLLTLPPFQHGIAIRGDGFAATRLTNIDWLAHNRVLYWGDVDTEGLEILALIRRSLPHVESLLMDQETLRQCHEHLGTGNVSERDAPSHLKDAELAAYRYCQANNARLEQESIPQNIVDEAVKLAANRAPSAIQ